MAATLRALCCLSALCAAAGAQPVTGYNTSVTSPVPRLNEPGSHPIGNNVIPLLSQFTGQDPLEAESTDEAGGVRKKRTYFCNKCGYGGGYGHGHWGGYRPVYTVVVPVRVVARPVYYYHPVYYRRRGGYCDPCSRRGYYRPSYGGGGGGYSYAESYSYSRAYSSGKR